MQVEIFLPQTDTSCMIERFVLWEEKGGMTTVAVLEGESQKNNDLFTK